MDRLSGAWLHTMASVNKRESVVCECLEISRGDGSEPPKLDWSKIENLIVYDEHGCEIRVGDIYKNQKTILILVRVSDAVSVNTTSAPSAHRPKYYISRPTGGVSLLTAATPSSSPSP